MSAAEFVLRMVAAAIGLALVLVGAHLAKTTDSEFVPLLLISQGALLVIFSGAGAIK